MVASPSAPDASQPPARQRFALRPDPAVSAQRALTMTDPIIARAVTIRLDDKIARTIFGTVQFLRFTFGLAEAAVFLALTYLFIYLAPMAL